MKSELLDRAEAALRALPPAVVPDGLAERATRAAFSSVQTTVSFLDQFFQVAWKTAALASLAVILVALWPQMSDSPEAQLDPLELTASLPTAVADPTYAALGGLR